MRNPDTSPGRERYRFGSQGRSRDTDGRRTSPDERYRRTKHGLKIGRLRLENIARIFGLACCLVLLVVVVGLSIVTAVCAVRGYRWPTIAGPSGLGAGSAVVLYRLLIWIGKDGHA